MRPPDRLPPRLRHNPFRTQEGLRHGLTHKILAGPWFHRIHTGVVICADTTLTFTVYVFAALLVLPPDVALSHQSALRWWGVEIGDPRPVHFSTNTRTRVRREGIVLHRRQGRLRPRFRDGVNVLGPDRSFVDAACTLDIVELIKAGDWLLHLKHTDLDTLHGYAWARHLDGVLRARRALTWVRERVESPMETVVRLMIVWARLPEPDTNRDIFDPHGRFVARGDMPYFRYKVLVEYDGKWHERDPVQCQRDRERRQQLNDLGWCVIVVLSSDLPHKQGVVWRVYHALCDRGYDGREPLFNAMWSKWFA